MAEHDVQLETENGWVTIGKTGGPLTFPEITYELPASAVPGDTIVVNVSYPCRIGNQDDWDRVHQLGAYAPQPAKVEEEHIHEPQVIPPAEPSDS
jgi:hypothetical protein